MKTLSRVERYLLMTATMVMPALLAAQVLQPSGSTQHHHYKLIDIGTFGGPSTYFNSLDTTDVFGFGTVFYNMAQVRNRGGIFVGFAETPTPDPYPGFCYVPDCFVAHAFEWRDGVKTDLGTLPGGASSAPFWINAKGWIAGNSQNGETDPLIPGLPELRAVLWKNGEIHDLGTLGGTESFSQAINNRGQVTGLALNAISDPYSYFYQFLYAFPGGTQTRAFLWDEADGMLDIGTLGGPDAFPSVMNNRGQVAGFSYVSSIPDPSLGLPPFHPFLWDKEKGMQDLGSFGGVFTASVNGLNERGEVIGGLDLPGDQILHPFLWDGEKLIDLTAAPFSEGLSGEARWINEAGDVVGNGGVDISCEDLPSQAHSFLWMNGAITDLGMVVGTPNSQADFVNNQRQIVGGSWSCDGSVVNAFLWENGSVVDLDTLTDPGSLHLYWAPYIDDRGVIAALGSVPDGSTHTVLLVPCDEDHAGIQYCDYSMVEASTAPAAPAGLQEQPGHMRQNTMWRRKGRFHFPALSSSN